MIQRAVKEFGRIDIVVSNAGLIRMSRFEDLALQAFDYSMRVNAYAPFLLAHAAWPYFLDQGYGRLLIVSSTACLTGMPDAADYGASKGAALGLASSLAAEAHDTGITVNTLLPVAVTDMSVSASKSRWLEEFGLSEAELRETTPYLVSVMVAWLTHEDCSANGELFEAGKRLFRRILVGVTNGYEDHAPTPESVRDHFGEIVDANGVSTRPRYYSGASGRPRRISDTRLAAEQVGRPRTAIGRLGGRRPWLVPRL